MPLEQPHAQPVLQLAHLVADGGGRYRQFFGRSLEAQVAHRRLEGTQRSQRRKFSHGRSLWVSSIHP